ncbi:AglZ/HisF2 family acetamidino modification protein [Aequorivita lipolytica]|uniref:imidazole glycerol-phosphate synthase n=1 Tax=Aequorivita lipolytica TaxID=153267 RepID=A0A5C6YP06_9FLAO|nr:AglZ/HisF2 family acetamidino modification protein [Aequorivita lipolytica]TXD68597.1 glycosyl amidation-associated protein WbuZ [Aequorivita lipolytica]SRX53252.1 Imidazole glycerol phosphate synthase subunit HisF [Aequorivita lipolytica]
MRRIRIIPVLLIQNGGLVKSIKFKDHKYIGDPINAVKIFNEKEVDEIVILDISASKENRGPNIEKLTDIAGEAFMPLSYGGGITTIEQVKKLLYQGAEKVILNTSTFDNPKLLTQIAEQFGSQSAVVSIDVKKDWLGNYKVYRNNGKKNTNLSPVDFAKKVEEAGAGEIILTSIDRDGTYKGFDIELIKLVADSVSIPVVACGGASKVADITEAIVKGGASAVAAGSLFVYASEQKGIMINYPKQNQLIEEVFSKL